MFGKQPLLCAEEIAVYLVYCHVQQLLNHVARLCVHHATENSVQFQAFGVIFGFLNLEDASLALPDVLVQVIQICLHALNLVI